MDKSIFDYKRKSYISIGEIFFWTTTINQWKHLLKRDDYKAKDSPSFLLEFAVTANNKNYEFWQRDSLAIHLFSKDVAFQKLDYIHNNPLAEHWQLVKNPCDYKYSTCNYYNISEKTYTFIKDLRDEF